MTGNENSMKIIQSVVLPQKKRSKTKRILAGISIFLLSVIGIVVLVLLGYVIYLSAQYYRIEDNLVLAVNNNQTECVSPGNEYSITTYNIGFGAYSQDFDFFMDSGTMLDGTAVSGTGSRAKSKETVLTNTNGAISEILQLDTDFAFFQEVDTNSTRSYHVNQYEMIQESFGDAYSSSLAINFHSGYLFYPLYEPHGTVNAGIVTLSKYKITEAVRRSFPIDEGFIAKFFDLDRCFEINRLEIEGSTSELVLINLHMSAYDEGGTIRALQWAMLTQIMQEEYEKGNYVIAGGDWNHDIADSLTYFSSQQQVPDWVAQLTESDLPDGFSFASSKNAPTCRSTDMAYEKGVNYTVVVDGFIVSNNVEVSSVTNIDTDFMFSDHNPVQMKFTLTA